MHARFWKLCAAALAVNVLGSCGGGGGGGKDGEPEEIIGVFSGFVGNLDWAGEGLGGDGSVGAGGDGDGGIGAGGDFGQFRGAIVRAYRQNGSLIGEAPTDNERGMVTIRPGSSYKGTLCIELRGAADASYYEEGLDQFVPFPAGRVIRVRVPRIDKNIGVTPFTEAAYRVLAGAAASVPDCAAARPTAAQIDAANETVRRALNLQFPAALSVDDITRLPFIKSPSLPAGAISTDPRGRYGLVNGAFSKQAAMFNPRSGAPTLDALEQLAEDLSDGTLDGLKGAAPAVPAAARTYDPNTLTGELSSALAQQATRFGSEEALDALPPVLNFGNTRYQGYLFDGSIDKDGKARSTVAGWVAGNALNKSLGDAEDKVPGGGRMFGFYGNHGHGGGFIKADGDDGQPKLYAFGDNVSGELGTGDRLASPEAQQIVLPGVLTHAAGGFAHTVARLADGSVYAWGDNSLGQLGQGNAVLARSVAPVRVVLPRGAVAVAATNTASYALLDNGTVFAWGSNGGFGLLGNGQRDGVQATPTRVGTLSEVVQITARDNDVAVLRRNQTVWHWGSFPADTTAFVPGDVTAAYEGGHLTPVQLSGLPAGVAVRKILTEQGLFVALLADGQVRTWGVYFDITAAVVLRDLTAVRVLGLPPLRDIMPGGFNGYGVRAFDRMTAMGIDYRGGMWKIRGRVAEQFDPANPAQQRRPQGQVARPDCQSCHVFLPDWPLTPAAPTSNAVCDPNGLRPDIHGTAAASLVHAETQCEQCHNPARTPPIAAFPEGWLTCRKPTTLPPRPTLVDPPLITTSCTIPGGHVYTPPGTVCASCHNSVIARPLQELGCAQPRSSELPLISTLATLTGAFDGASAIPAGSITRDATPTLRGSLSAPLAAGQSVRVLRNGGAVGAATMNTATDWSYTDGSAPQGAVSYAARVQSSGAFGPTGSALAFSIDSLAPLQTVAITEIVDDTLGNIAGSTGLDLTPTVRLSVSAPPAAGELLRVRRGGVAVGNATLLAGVWTYADTLPGLGSYVYDAQVVDAAGNTGPLSATQSVTIIASTLSTATIDAVAYSGAGLSQADGTQVLSGGTIGDSTPRITVGVDPSLPGGQLVRLLRDGVSIGTASACGSSCVIDDPGASQGLHVYTARVEAGAVLGAPSAPYQVTVDTVAPTAPTISGLVNNKPYQNNTADTNVSFGSGATVGDPTPQITASFASLFGTGEVVALDRWNGLAWAQVTSTGSGTSLLYNQPALLNGVGGAPSANPGTQFYRARRTDAAGNVATTGTFQFGNYYLVCSQARALSKANNTTHQEWPAGTAQCVTCHTSPTATGFVAAPPPGGTDRYWCRKS